MQHEFGVSVDELDQSEEEALVAAGVQVGGFLFKLQAGGLLPNEGQTLEEKTWLEINLKTQRNQK